MRVTQLHVNHDTDLTDITVRHGKTRATTTVHTTQHHPFWDETAHRWVDAGNLTSGHALHTPGAGKVIVVAVHNYAGHRTMYNLTVADLHTYYVMAGSTPVLVHNAPCGPGLGPGVEAGVGNLRDGAQMATNDALDTAVDFLGSGYKDMGGGRFLSRDGLRQVRMTDRDLAHPRQNPHINFETYHNPIGPGIRGGNPSSNIHIYLPEEPGWHLP